MSIDSRRRLSEEKRQEIMELLREQDGMDQSDLLEEIEGDEEKEEILKRLIDSGEIAVTLDWEYKPVGS